MPKLLITLAILCAFEAASIEGFDKKAAVAAFTAKLDECKTEVGAKDVDIEKLVGKMAATSMEGKCLRSCLLKKFDVMDNNGKIVKKVAISYAENFLDGSQDEIKIAHEIIDACADIEVSSDHCEASEQYGKCFIEQAAAHGIKELSFQ